jgi:hypothetical protein
MRWLLAILAIPSGGAALLLLIAAFTPTGSDFHFIGSGVFLTAFVLAVGLIGVLVRLEQIRDSKRE